MAEITAPGVYDIPEAEYHADPVPGGSLSSTIARKLLPPSSPALARWAMDHPEHRDAFDLGSVVHALVLGVGAPIVEVQADDWRGKAAKEARDQARAEGKTPLLTRDLTVARRMADAVHADPIASRILAQGQPERTYVWRDEETGEWCRSRVDWTTPTGLLVDLKTTEDPSPYGFAKSVRTYGYDIQDAHYTAGHHAVTGEWAPFLFIAVAKTPPHLVHVHQLDEVWRADGYERHRRALDVWAQCRESGVWPAHNDEIHTLSLPRWAR